MASSSSSNSSHEEIPCVYFRYSVIECKERLQACIFISL